jgi:hypothetical protein
VKKKWSRDVTEHSDALDLGKEVFTRDDPKAIARSPQALRRAQQTAQEQPLSLGDVDADLLHQSGRARPFGASPQGARGRQGELRAAFGRE